jgi:rfaE bifunctional protein nucleotidyltransferase chain/domain/rfaE bifunctional protein kinase chain/domain
MTRPLVVVGDLMLDVDLVGRAERLSPEAPVPVVVDPTESRRPGGAALAALLAARTYPRVVLIAPLADDDAAREVARMLAGRVELIGLPWAGSTPIKTRVRAGDHPITRLDSGGQRGRIGPLPPVARAALASAAAVLVADYGRGISELPELRDELAALRAPVVWDPHPNGAEPVPGARLVTPNEVEAGVPAPGTIIEVRQRAQSLAQRWGAQSVAITLGARGALLHSGSGAPLVVPARSVPGGDTCGAGDAFAAAAVVALASGSLPSEAVAEAVSAAADFVAAGGAAGFSSLESESARGGGVDVQAVLQRVRASGGRVVATGGCFDLLHVGHIATLEAARGLGDCLVVCLNSDESVRRLKGEGRPLQDEHDRALVLAALRFVDAVVTFDEDTPVRLLSELRPDVWVKGGDYTGAVLPESAVLAEWGGEVITLPYLAGRSTSQLVEQVRTK